MYPWNKADVTANLASIQVRFAKARSFLQSLRFRVPLTLQGTLTLSLSLYLIIHGLSNRNAYEILLGAILGLLLGILLGTGYVVRRASNTLAPTWQIPTPVCATEGSTKNLTPDSSGVPQGNLHRITGIPKAPLFFRIHFEVRGKLTMGNQGIFYYSVDWSTQSKTGWRKIHTSTNNPQGNSTTEITGILSFPMGGQFQGMGYRTLRDIFGMVQFRLPPVLHRTFAVFPTPSKKQVQLRLDPSLGVEEKRTLRSADEERYFMREYAPGDRFRDINWKTSSRLAFLVTRIAPQAQEKTRILPVAFRCFGPERPDLLALCALDRCKAWLFQFLWTVRREHPEFILRVTTPLFEEELTTDQEMEQFCEEIAGYTYRSLAEEEKFAFLATTPEEVFVFSTSYDGGLNRFVGARFDHPTHFYVTSPLRRFTNRNYVGKRELSASLQPPASFSVRGCVREGGILYPHLLLPTPIPSSSPSRPLRGTLEIEYVEVSL